MNFLTLFFFITIFVCQKLNAIKSHNFNQQILQTRIYGGKPARPGQFPYQVGIYSSGSMDHGGFSYWCGGTLISNQYVLTAAHCLCYDNGDLLDSAIVYLGILRVHGVNDTNNITINVFNDSFTVHTTYNQKTLIGDIALIRLPTPVQFTKFIQAAKLPRRSHQIAKLIGSKIISSGWGQTSDDLDSRASILQYMDTRIVDDDECFNKTSKKLFNPESQICINSFGKSICEGDSGGPNVLDNDKEEDVIVIGISSYIDYDYLCTNSLPQVITRVAFYLDWIHEHTGIPIL